MSVTPQQQQAFDNVNASIERVNELFNIYEYDAERDMHDHLISQFQERPVIRAILNALGEELDLIVQAAGALMTERWIDTGEGAQLDGIGRIVGRDRTIPNAIYLPFFGFYGQPNAGGFSEAPFRDSGVAWQSSTILDDGSYRKVLWAKVFKNTSHCTFEDTISMLKVIFTVGICVVEDAGNAKIRLSIGRRLTTAELLLIKAYNLFIRAGGVGIRYAVQYDPDNYFGFLGQPRAKGFSEGAFADIVDI
jgi:hypothetical protein